MDMMQPIQVSRVFHTFDDIDAYRGWTAVKLGCDIAITPLERSFFRACCSMHFSSGGETLMAIDLIKTSAYQYNSLPKRNIIQFAAPLNDNDVPSKFWSVMSSHNGVSASGPEYGEQFTKLFGGILYLQLFINKSIDKFGFLPFHVDYMLRNMVIQNNNSLVDVLNKFSKSYLREPIVSADFSLEPISGGEEIFVSLISEMRRAFLKDLKGRGSDNGDHLIYGDKYDFVFKSVMYALSKYRDANLKLKNISVITGYSEALVTQSFKKALGVNVREWHVMHRLSLARNYLIDYPDVPVNKVGHLFGFNHASRFSGSMQSLFGQTPSELRASSAARSNS